MAGHAPPTPRARAKPGAPRLRPDAPRGARGLHVRPGIAAWAVLTRLTQSWRRRRRQARAVGYV
eukprot:scaffold3570_cov132-Isochrysis_galbana.AAC.3